jgi:hypothetical protein
MLKTRLKITSVLTRAFTYQNVAQRNKTRRIDFNHHARVENHFRPVIKLANLPAAYGGHVRVKIGLKVA